MKEEVSIIGRIENFGSGTVTGTFSGWWAELINLGLVKLEIFIGL